MGTIGRSALIALAACGGTTAVTSDAPPLPPPIDAIAPGPATLAITNAGAPVAGVQVWFQAADGNVIAETTTDATGTASAVVAPGAIVTVLGPFGGAGDLRTYVGVQPGDRLTLDQPAVENVTMDVVVPVDPEASAYLVFSTCGETVLPDMGTSGPVSFLGCDGTTDLMIESLFADSEEPSGTLYVPNVTLTDGGTIDLSGMSYTTLQAQTFTYTYQNQSFFIAEACNELAGAHGVVLDVCSSAGFETAAGTEYAFPVPMADATFVVDTQGNSFQGDNGQPYSRQDILDWGPFSQGYQLDTGAAALPEFMAPPTFDSANHRITWNETIAGSVPDFTVAFLAGGSFTWEIAAPYRSEAFDLPVLPLDAPLPIEPSLALVLLVGVAGGYDAARPTVLSTLYLSGQRASPRPFITGASGHAAMTQWTVE